MPPQSAPYGTWSSPMTAEMITKGVLPLSGLVVDPISSKLYHLEARPSEGGRITIIDTPSGTDLTPSKDWNVRTGVHEYGGGAAIAYGETLYFSNLVDGRVYRLKEGGSPEAVTPENKVHRFADFNVHPIHTHLLVSILEDHTIDEPSAIVNTLCVINTVAKTVHPLISGADFYASPKFSPDGTRLAWQQWSHPDMPWEGSHVYIADVVIRSYDGLSLKNFAHVAGEALKISAVYPSWANNDTLVFTSDESGYINPWMYQNGKATALFPKPIQYEFGSPGWLLQTHPYAIVDEKGGLAVFITTKDGRNGLDIVDLTGGSPPRTIETPFVVVENIWSLSRKAREIIFSGEKVDEGLSVVKLTLDDTFGTRFTVLKPAPVPEFSSDFISVPKPMSLEAPNGELVHVVYHPPKNPDYLGSSVLGERPPCVVLAHGGPTAIAMQNLSWTTQYFTSRGWAWLAVNYGGSSGYGREYIRRLDGKWGIVDSDDCIRAAQIISSEPYNLVDPKRLVIRGRSAGGYTVLGTLANAPDVTTFAAGAASFGISDLLPLEAHTHKFESRQLEKLLGGMSAQVPELYRDRSPVNHADRIVAPLLILQGEIDRVVPKEQAELICEKVAEKGGVIEYKLYQGEGHGWRQAETIIDALERELGFYKRVLGLKS
ncbi:Dipeptidyl peptidase family member 6 [Termitomyces sp. T112]|nr:Dipeptidyl peptidase family member 6 [Termitomyces sp. T112]